ncbi:uncharacterized protein LOC112346447 [Selaginella moellendorffii]|uniref:uncharacterized protein LOC112346447 n=1 Tax=Selaginella moellendorffii TaxID=88036 RepID=UPI000D1CECD8|nr:uncharacterized protein LOC112346447 [Selaginella moellendorffii]|eukprot:XP_024531240.1 uncharacterized protein LOC112346447 [Selaginella moellendorffii]
MAMAMAKNRVRRKMCDRVEELEEVDRHPLLVHHRRRRPAPRKFASSLPNFSPARSSSAKNSGSGNGASSSILSCVGLSGEGKRGKNLVTLVVGEEERAFRVEPQILDHGVVQCLLEKTTRCEAIDREWREAEEIEEEGDSALFAALDGSSVRRSWSMDHHHQRHRHPHRRVIRVDCDAILFEHILWLLGRDDPSLRHLNVDELMEFYS